MRPLETTGESCYSCKFWAGVRTVQTEEGRVLTVGTCRKSAPVANANGEATWPATMRDDWCADYTQGATPDTAKRFL